MKSLIIVLSAASIIGCSTVNKQDDPWLLVPAYKDAMNQSSLYTVKEHNDVYSVYKTSNGFNVK